MNRQEYMEGGWKFTQTTPAPEGVILDTKYHDDDGCMHKRPMILRDRVWGSPDGELYVYYRPTHWREQA